MFGPDVDAAIQEHARACYPRESCGVVKAGVYVPLENLDPDPEHAFDFDRQVLLDPEVQAVAHSHPGGPAHPSETDMRQQMAMALPWGLVTTDGHRAGDVMWWGPGVPTPPLIGRGFRHGPSGSDGCGDCYALVRDWYQTHRGVLLDEFPRDDEWWNKGQDLYAQAIKPQGFVPVSLEDLQPGDGVLAHVLSPVVNHAGIYVGNGLILHHLPNRLSREEPLMRWRHLITHTLRLARTA